MVQLDCFGQLDRLSPLSLLEDDYVEAPVEPASIILDVNKFLYPETFLPILRRIADLSEEHDLGYVNCDITTKGLVVMFKTAEQAALFKILWCDEEDADSKIY